MIFRITIFRRKHIIIITASLLVVAAVLLLYFFNPTDPEVGKFFLKCPFKTLTGLKCPGCGSQRAFHHLFHGNFAEAMRMNALMILAIPYVIMGIAIYLRKHEGMFARCGTFLDKADRLFFHGAAPAIILTVVIIFWILRNIFPEVM